MQNITFLIIAFFIVFPNILFAQHLKKDGTPDRRYKENKSYSAPSNYSSSSSHLKKDGTPDRRYKENKTYFSIPSTSASPSFKYYTSTKKHKTIYYYGIERDAS